MNRTGPVARIAKALSKIEKNELKATFVSMVFAFMLMASWYVLRPVRDGMASDWSDSEVAYLWRLNLYLSAVLVAVFGFAVCRVRLRHLVATIYCLFALSFLGLYAGAQSIDDRMLIDKTFYLWLSVFALFNTSVFWTFMTDTFNKEQSKRLFAVIAAGASAGALVGPALPTLFGRILGNDTLVLIASLGLLSIVPLIFYLYRLKGTELGNAALRADTSGLGGRWWRGFSAFATSPYLLGIGAFILLYTYIGSFVYFEQKNLLEVFSREERTQILGAVDWITNVLTFVLAFFITGRVVQRLGMPIALALMPVLVCAGLAVLAFAPVITVVLALQVFRRGGNYGLTRPAREMLFTKVSPEDRFKSKPVIDIVVYRGGDASAATLFSVLTDKMGLGLAAVAAVGAGIAAFWGWVGVRLGRKFDENAADVDGALETESQTT